MRDEFPREGRSTLVTDAAVSVLIMVGWLGTTLGLMFLESSPLTMLDTELDVMNIYIHFIGCMTALTLGPIMQIISQVFWGRDSPKFTNSFGSLCMVISLISCVISIKFSRYEYALPVPFKIYEILVGLSALMSIFENIENDTPARIFCRAYSALLYRVLFMLSIAMSSRTFDIFINITYNWLSMTIILLLVELAERLLMAKNKLYGQLVVFLGRFLGRVLG